MATSKKPDKAPYIFDAQFPNEVVPPGFNAVRVVLDAQMRSSLDWKKSIEAAKSFQEQGFQLFWDLQLGLFRNLSFPLAHDMQFKSLCLGMDHFIDAVWKEFEAATLGACLYRGPLNFSRTFSWDAEQKRNWVRWLREGFSNIEALNLEAGTKFPDFEACDPDALPAITPLFCQDVCCGYLDLLSQKLPDKLQSFLCLDATLEEDPLLQAQLLNRERLQHFETILKGARVPTSGFAWESKGPAYGLLARFPYPVSEPPESTWGICLPPAAMRRPSHYRGLREALLYLQEKGMPYKIIPEAMLTAEWEGLDNLVIVHEGLTPQGLRKLQGFEAAGGTLVEACQLMKDRAS